MGSLTPTLFATPALCLHMVLQDCPAVFVCSVKGIVEHGETQRLEGIQKKNRVTGFKVKHIGQNNRNSWQDGEKSTDVEG